MRWPSDAVLITSMVITWTAKSRTAMTGNPRLRCVTNASVVSQYADFGVGAHGRPRDVFQAAGFDVHVYGQQHL
jgi:hypothetical protein